MTVTVTANATTAPDGTLTADKIVEKAVTDYHELQQVVLSVSPGTYTVSCYFKAAERSVASLHLRDTGGSELNALFDVANGTTLAQSYTLGGAFTYIASRIDYAGNAWWRAIATFSYSGAAGNLSIGLDIDLNANTYSYLGVVGNGIYVWGARLDAGANAASYFYNEVFGAPTLTLGGDIPMAAANLNVGSPVLGGAATGFPPAFPLTVGAPSIAAPNLISAQAASLTVGAPVFTWVTQVPVGPGDFSAVDFAPDFSVSAVSVGTGDFSVVDFGPDFFTSLLIQGLALATGSPVISAPTLSGAYMLTATSLAPRPVLGVPALGFPAASLATSAPQTTTPALVQNVTLTANEIVIARVLLFEDLFVGPTLDATKWAALTGPGPSGYDAEYFDPAQIAVSNGLTITANRSSAQPGYTWRSGSISTHGKFTFSGGYAQIRMRQPNCGSGAWPVFWFSSGGLGGG